MDHTPHTHTATPPSTLIEAFEDDEQLLNFSLVSSRPDNTECEEDQKYFATVAYDFLDYKAGPTSLILSDLQPRPSGEIPLPANLGSLFLLDLSGNGLRTIPSWLGSLHTLEDVRLARNALGEFPMVLCTLPRIRFVSLLQNLISQVPTLPLEWCNQVAFLDLTLNPIVCTVEDAKKFHSCFQESAIVVTDIPAQIRPGLFLGSLSCLMNPRELDLLGITHIVSLCQDCPTLTNRVQLIFRVTDRVTTDLLTDVIPQCLDFISHGNSTLVHCTAGVSRSASIVIAYLMWKEGLSFDQAYADVQRARPMISPNVGFVEQLRKFEERLRMAAVPAESSRFESDSAAEERDPVEQFFPADQ
jgi:hypothetical protein